MGNNASALQQPSRRRIPKASTDSIEPLLPFDLQQIICHMAIGPQGNNKFAFVAMTVCKTWAHFVCSVLYRNFSIQDYLQFVGLVNAITSVDPILPYSSYVRSIDFSTVNRYGVDMRAHKLIRHCPNLLSVAFGHPTSVRPHTVRMMAQYCQKLHTLQLGGLESFPFMLDCDFSGMTSLKTVEIYTTPLTPATLHTLPRTLEKFRLVRVDSIDTAELARFLSNRKATLQSVVIDTCRHIPQLQKVVDILRPLQYLRELELSGPNVTDEVLEGLEDLPLCLDTLSFCNTHITSQALQRLSAGRLTVRHLGLSRNPFISPADDLTVTPPPPR